MNIKEYLNHLTINPGVYLMIDKQGKVIYVGKAKNLKRRVSQYFVKQQKNKKTKALVANIKNFEVVVTDTETQALILENELIKQHKPRYNILLKDAKSYPYIFVSDDKHPRAGFYRGNKNKKYKYFGPYPSSNMVRDSLSLLKKIFKIRQCTNSVYRSRSRPCLEYQIGLCSAPCVSKISDDNYTQDVAMMSLFLSGKGAETLKLVADKMQNASKDLDFELAAHYRDQLISLRTIQEQHTSRNMEDIDVVCCVEKDSVYAVEVIFIRKGKQAGNECLFPKNTNTRNVNEVLSAFLPQYYIDRDIPKQIIINEHLEDKKLISSALNTRIIDKPRSDKKHYLNVAILTAKESLNRHLSSKFTKQSQLLKLQKTLNLKSVPKLIECFDISHTMGEATTASCVVFEKGLAKVKNYRQFNIKDITPGDDYAAINQAVFRRYSRQIKEKKALPDLVLIDGGIGQLNQAIMVLDSIGIESIKLVGIAKGEGRKAGLETLITINNEKTKKINLKPHDEALLLVNNIRDESHRFAIKSHRKKRDNRRKTSPLESIQGVGKLRRMAILNHFGGIQEVQKASTKELQKVSGISDSLATKIVASFKK
jgi:excinuclease ABC subunit C